MIITFRNTIVTDSTHLLLFLKMQFTTQVLVTPYQTMQLSMIQVGDAVVRHLGSIDLNLVVTKVTDAKIYCGDWKFDKNTGAEIDKDLRFPASYITKL